MNIDNSKIAVIGLGYVGLPLAVGFGATRPVIGFDINGARVEELRGGNDSTLEVTPEQLKNAKHLAFSDKVEDLAHAGVFIVTVPTPIDEANRPDLRPLISASEMIGKVMPKGAIVIYESTVFPGATEEVCVPALERASGRRFNVDFYAGYSPERIVPADKVHT
ncbi:MAG TPA: Vi polysaccharide biosynthesis UDP-N-acetylglucosamine C-6 dehydrogenase TviB, partial [Candidatus Defluviicoccus seviourii]|nr:Vi polysaccharide biosynthesis UDP-N-acetylglucosamine C-6 dehydrogenase TviB [Candidatus Defluviicoccus seviourii]